MGDATERFIQLLKAQIELTPDVEYQLTITRRAGGEGQEAWAYFGMKIQLMGCLIGDDAKFDQVWQRLEVLTEFCGW